MPTAFGSRFAAHRAELFKRVAHIGFFQKLTDEEKSELLRYGRFTSYNDGQVIFSQGDQDARLMYFVVSGEVAIELDGYKNQSGSNAVAVLKSGELFGEVAILDKMSRSATARARGVVTVLSLDLFPDEPRPSGDTPLHLAVKILRYIAEGLCAKLRNANEILLHSKS